MHLGEKMLTRDVYKNIKSSSFLLLVIRGQHPHHAHLTLPTTGPPLHGKERAEVMLLSYFPWDRLLLLCCKWEALLSDKSSDYWNQGCHSLDKT